MKKSRLQIVCWLIALVSLGVAAQAQEKAAETPASQPKEEAKDKSKDNTPKDLYKNIEVAKFDAAPGIEFPPDYSKAVMDDTVKSLVRAKKFDKVYSEGDSTSDQTGPTIRVVGTVTKFKPGSQTKRYFLGPLAGRTTVAVHVKFLDKSTGNVLFEKDFQGIVMGGLFGGDSKDSVSIVGTRISDTAKKEFFSKKK